MPEYSRSLKRPDNAIIHYRIICSDNPRPLLVLIHGLASNMTRWSEFVAQTRLVQAWDVLRLDLRGHGHSVIRGPISMKVWCDDLAALMKEERYEHAVIVGHSLGAQVGMHFCATYPRMVDGIVMIDPVFPENLRGRLLQAKRFRFLLRLLIGLVRGLNRLGIYRRSIAVHDLQALDAATRKKLDTDPNADISRLYANPFADLKTIATVNYLQDAYEVTRELPPLENIMQPVLVLLSVNASVADANKNQEIIKRFPNMRIVRIDANHWPLTEKPRETRVAIESWCDTLL